MSALKNVFDQEALEKANEAFESAWQAVFSLASEGQMESQVQLAARRLLSYNPQHRAVEEKCPDLYAAVNSVCAVVTDRIKDLAQSQTIENWTILLYCYLMLNDMPNAYTTVAHVLRLSQKIKEPYFLYCAGIVYQHFHYHEDAAQFFQQIPDSFEQSTDRNFRLAITYRSLNKFSDAESLFKSLVSRPPQGLTSADIKMHIAYTLQLEEKNSEAAKIYDELYIQNPNCSELKQQYIWFLSLQNDSRSWAHADELIGTSTDSILRFASARIAMKQQNMSIAYQRYRECTSVWSDSPLFWFGLGVLYLRNEQLTDAIIAFQRALYLKSEIPEAWLNLGLIFEIQNEGPNALKIYQTAKSNCPNSKIVEKRLAEFNRPQRRALKENLLNEVIEIDGNRLFTQPMERNSELQVSNPPFLSESLCLYAKLPRIVQPYTSIFK